jgi:predicted metal-dependent phosphoesterase TrpH
VQQPWKRGKKNRASIIEREKKSRMAVEVMHNKKKRKEKKRKGLEL